MELVEKGRMTAHTFTHLDALESESIHIMREVAAECKNPALLFSGGKDSIVMLRLAEKAFRPAKFPFPLVHIDTEHNFPEVIAFRDRRAAELGERLIVRSLEDSITQGHGGAEERNAKPQCVPVGDIAGDHRRIRLRCLHGRRAARRGKIARQGAHLLVPRRVRPVGPEEPAPRAVGHLQHPRASGREHPRVPDQQLDRDGHLAIHRPRETGDTGYLFRARARRDPAPRRHHAGQRTGAAASRARRWSGRPCAFAPSATSPAPARWNPMRGMRWRSSQRLRSRASPNAARRAWTTRLRMLRWSCARRKGISDGGVPSPSFPLPVGEGSVSRFIPPGEGYGMTRAQR